MKKIILLLILGSAFTLTNYASASTIVWGSSSNIFGDGDVSTAGNLFTAQAFNGSDVTVNSVPFEAYSGATSSDTNVTLSATFGTSSAGTPSGLSPSYTSLLSNGIYLYGSSGTLTLNNLTLGNSYQVELFSNDSRAFTSSYGLTLTAGNSVTIYDRPGGGPEGQKGQYVIGTFTADSSLSQVITLNPGSGYPFLNALQVREVSAVPEPSSYALLVSGLGALSLLARRRYQS